MIGRGSKSRSRILTRLRTGVLLAMLLCPWPTLAGGQTVDPALNATIEDAWAFGKTRLNATISYIKAASPTGYLWEFPRSTYTSGTATGQWRLRAVTDWESGFFPGAMWLMYQKTGDAAMLAGAKDWSGSVESLKDTGIDHDMGFRFLPTFYNAYKFSNSVNDPGGTYKAHAKDVLLAAAAALDTRYNMGGVPANAIKCEDGDPSPYGTYIDNAMNLPLYFVAWDLAGRPTSGAAKTWYDHGVTCANTLLAQHMRSFGPSDPRAADDGSTYHLITHHDGTVPGHPAADGTVYKKFTGQGFGNESTWSRGQAWGLFGFAQIYHYTRNDPSANPGRFLDASERMANYFISHLPNNYTADRFNHVAGDFVPPADFDAALGEPAGPWNDANNNGVYGDRRAGTSAFCRRDSSAAAIAACGMFELSDLVADPTARQKYFKAGEDILRCLLTFTGSDSKLDYLAKDSTHMGILVGGSEMWNTSYDTDSLIYGDYYFLEAMRRYQSMSLGGDANRDGSVSFADYIVLANSFGQDGAWVDGDFSGDGKVGFADYIVLANNFGQSVPEPAVFALLGPGLLAILRPRRR